MTTNISVGSKVRLDGLLLEEHLFESVSDPDTMAGIYSCRVLPMEPYVVDELQQAFDLEAGFHVNIDNSEWKRSDGSVYCDSILQPHNGFKIDPKDLTPGKEIRITFKPVVNYTPDREAAYGQLQLIGFDPYIDQDSLIDWSECDGVDF